MQILTNRNSVSSTCIINFISIGQNLDKVENPRSPGVLADTLINTLTSQQ